MGENAQPATLTYYTSAGSSSVLSTEQFSYDGDLRPQTDTASWGSASGASGQIASESRWYDAAGNVASLSTTQAALPGQSGTGGSETENFCYDEQNRLVFASNIASPTHTGSETCGNQTPSNSLSGASYTTSYVYTHLGQLWQGPVAGDSTTYQYLYRNSSNPHQLTDLVPAGQNYSCSNLPQSIPYTLAYNSWGDAKTRATSAGTATLNYNDFDQLVEWHIPSTNQAWFGYDASGTRTVQHTTVGSTSSTTIYAFGLEEYSYDGSGNLLSSTHYYSLAGHLLGELQITGSSSTTNFFLTDGLGSVLGVFSNTASSAALLSTQLFTPYGTQLVSNGNSIGQYTAKGFTGQYADTVSGLDYYVSRYYDPVVGVFLAADKALGDPAGMNPYGYVGNNPETETDPTGQYYSNGTSIQQHGRATAYVSGNVITTVTNDGYGTYWSLSGQETWNPYGGLSIDSSTTQQITTYGGYNPNTDASNSPWQKFLSVTGWTQLQQNWNAPGATTWDRIKAIFGFIGTNVNNLLQLAAIFGGPEDEGVAAAEDVVVQGGKDVITLYRGTSYADEIAAFNDSGGYVFSDAARSAYLESRTAGNSIEEALQIAQNASVDAHAAQLEHWGSLDEYVLQHAWEGVHDVGVRSMMSWTSDPSVVSAFRGESGVIFRTTVSLSEAIPQTSDAFEESEYLILHLITAKLVH